jgi:hypothetical protein
VRLGGRAAATALGLALCSATACAPAAPGQAVQALSAELARELPVGSSPEKALAFLEARHAEHSGYVAHARTIYASLSVEAGRDEAPTTVILELRFDEARRLREASIRRAFPAR